MNVDTVLRCHNERSEVSIEERLRGLIGDDLVDPWSAYAQLRLQPRQQLRIDLGHTLVVCLVVLLPTVVSRNPDVDFGNSKDGSNLRHFETNSSQQNYSLSHLLQILGG